MNPLIVKNFDQDVHKVDSSMIDHRLPKPYWQWILQGVSGSGKTNLAIQIIEWYKKFHDKYIIVSPLIKTDKTMKMCIYNLIQDGYKVKDYSKYTPAVIEEIEYLIYHNNDSNILLIMDDMTAESGVDNHCQITGKWVTQMRKQRVNLLFLCHTYIAVHKTTRTQAKYFTTFGLNKYEYRQFEEERGLNPSSYLEHVKNRKKDGDISKYSFITHWVDNDEHHISLNLTHELEVQQ